MMMIAVKGLSLLLLLVLKVHSVISECPGGTCKYACDFDELEQGQCCRNRKCCVPCTLESNPCIDDGGICRNETCTSDELPSGDIKDCCEEAQCCLDCTATCTEAGGQCKDSCLLCEFQRSDLGCCNGRSCCIESICEVQEGSEPVSLDCYYPFGSLGGDTPMGISDDTYESLTLIHDFPFFGNLYPAGDLLHLGTNGIITFVSGVSVYTPNPFPLSNNIPMIAPYWGDTDIRRGGNIWYRQTMDPTLLGFASTEVQTVFSEFPNFSASWMFIATWYEVVSFGDYSANPLRNNFQVVLVTDGTLSFVMFFLYKLEWLYSTEDASEIPSQAGFNAGDGIQSYTMPGSRTPAIQDAALLSNMGVSGRYMFRVDEYNLYFPSAPLDICRVGVE